MWTWVGLETNSTVGLVSCYLVFPSVLGQKWIFNDFKRLSIMSEVLAGSNHSVETVFWSEGDIDEGYQQRGWFPGLLCVCWGSEGWSGGSAGAPLLWLWPGRQVCPGLVAGLSACRLSWSWRCYRFAAATCLFLWPQGIIQGRRTVPQSSQWHVFINS